MKTNVYLLLVCTLLLFCQGCIKELHKLPPRPQISVKLNGLECDTIRVKPSEEIQVEVEFKASEGILREVSIKDQAGAQLPGFPVTLDSADLQNQASYSYSFKANDFMPNAGKTYQTYTFQLICQDDNQPKQLINKNICILVTEELYSYTVTLGAQDNPEHGCFLNLNTGKVFTRAQATEMSITELQQIELCYFYDEKALLGSDYAYQQFWPLAAKFTYLYSWYWFTTAPGYAKPEYQSYSFLALEQLTPPAPGTILNYPFPGFMKYTSHRSFESFRYTSDLTNYKEHTYNGKQPMLYGVYIIATSRYMNWPEDQQTQEYKPSVIRVREFVPGPAGYMVLDVKASTKYNF